MAEIIACHPLLVLRMGDMVAGQREIARPTNLELKWKSAALHAAVGDPLAQAGNPILVTPGNHDASAYPGYEAERHASSDAWGDR